MGILTHPNREVVGPLERVVEHRHRERKEKMDFFGVADLEEGAVDLTTIQREVLAGMEDIVAAEAAVEDLEQMSAGEAVPAGRDVSLYCQEFKEAL